MDTRPGLSRPGSRSSPQPCSQRTLDTHNGKRPPKKQQSREQRKPSLLFLLKTKRHILFITKFIGSSPNFNDASPNIEI